MPRFFGDRERWLSAGYFFGVDDRSVRYHTVRAGLSYELTGGLAFVADAQATRSSVYNAGREVHEFDSPILTYAVETPPSRATEEPADSSPTILRPGQSLRIVLAPPPGTYLYSCRRKGHVNMTGTLIVD